MTAKQRAAAWTAGAVSAALLLYVWRVQAALLVRLLAGGAAAAYLFYPLARRFERHFGMNRALSILCTFLTALGVLALTLVLIVPPLFRQMRELIASLPAFADGLRARLRLVNDQLSAHGLSRLTLPEPQWERLLPSLPPLLGGTASFAGSLFGSIAQWVMIFILAYYFLRDRERVLLHLELMIPSALRPSALTAAAAVHREIGTFLRGQAVIGLLVGTLSALALMLSGVRAWLPLGMIVGLFNLIPYFGPILGAIPAVLTALAQSPLTALFAAIGLFAVQQIDSLIISPRIMGAMTGLHPATVLLSITLGGSFAGVAGMLLAIPVLLAGRAFWRVRMIGKSTN